MPGVELELEKRRSRLGDGRRRRRKRETERSFHTFLQSAPDAISTCSFDQDDELSLSLARSECINGPVPVPVSDPDQEEKEKRIIETKNPAFQQDNQYPPENFFSDNDRECPNQRYPQISKKLSRQRPASLDLNIHVRSDVAADVAALSPFVSLGVMNKKGSINFPSPGTPVYPQQPGWHSERVPLSHQSYNNRASAAFPFNRRNLPSKWEDAERWILSPAQVPQFNRTRPKSKSGPLGSPCEVDEAAQVGNGNRIGYLVKSSPLWAGVLIPEDGRNCTAGASFSNCESVGGWMDTPLRSSCYLPSSRGNVQDERIEVTRKDMATQTSPCGSANASPKATPLSISSSESTTTANQIEEEEMESHFTELKIKNSFKSSDKRVTLTRWSNKHVVQGPDKFLTNIIEWKRRTVESKASSWHVTKTANCISKLEMEEAKVTAWENMQKNKAEAALEKLVMKLERKRLSSMDKILNKLKFAQKRAQEEVRTQTQSTLSDKKQEISKRSMRVPHFSRNDQVASLSGCFTCHAF